MLLSVLVVCVSWLISLALLATARGGASFLCPKRQRNEAKKTLSNHATLSVHSVQFSFIGAPKARCSPEPRMFEPLLLANPDIDTLRHQCSRASTICPGTSTASRVCAAAFLGGLAAWSARLFSGVGPYSFARRGSPMGWRRGCAERTNLVVGYSRIARDVPWAGSITGGEACQNPCTEKEGFTHPWLWRAPCFWGTHE